MRVWFCKIHCPPFICFCKPSPNIYTQGPLKLGNGPHVPSPTTVVSVVADKSNDDLGGDGEATEEVKRVDVDGKQQQEAENCVKSSIKKAPCDLKEEVVQKKRVQWMDLLGKELVEIREFECSETEDTDSDSVTNRSCVCVIL